MIKALGGNAVEKDDKLIIEGRGRLRGGTVDSFNDHRIAMSAAIASIICDDDVIIKGENTINKCPIPNASVKQFIVLAVYIPAQEPQVGQAKSSTVFDRDRKSVV